MTIINQSEPIRGKLSLINSSSKSKYSTKRPSPQNSLDNSDCTTQPLPSQTEGIMFIKTKNLIRKVALRDILFFGVDGKCAYVKTLDERLLLTISLKELTYKLNNKSFIRIHQSFLINISKIDIINPFKNIAYIKEVEIPIGRSYRKKFLNQIQIF